MELFKYRSLAFACGMFLITLICSFYLNRIIRIAILVLSGIAIFIFILLYMFKPNSLSFFLLVFGVPCAIFMCLALILPFTSFDKGREVATLCNGEVYEVEATVEDIQYSNDTMGIYIAQLHSINGREAKIKVSLTMYSEPIERDSVIATRGVFSHLESNKIGFDEKSYSLSLGVVADLTCEEYTVIGKSPNHLRNILDKANTYLDKRFDSLNGETHAMLSALFLGNKEYLDDSVKRDFTRIGMSHALALSGMHITIIITIIGFLLKPLRMRELFKSLIIMGATFFFVGMTGFSDSAMRAGLMVIITYSISFLGKRIDTVTALFLSATVICVIEPYSIFSVSLMLSFFAMLGCLVSSRLIRRMRLYRIIRIKLIRFVAYSFICTFLSLSTTLAYIFIVFGNVTVLSFITNVILSPLFSCLIYLSPAYLLLADIEYLGTLVGTLCEKITGLLISIAQWLSRLDGIVLPIQNTLQTVGVVLLALSTLALIVVSRKRTKYALIGVLASVLIFVSGYLSLIYERSTGVYVSAYSLGENDIIAVEHQRKITVIDITDNKSGHYSYSQDTSNYLGYYEIDNYILTELSKTSHLCFERLSECMILRNAYIPTPQSEEERAVYDRIVSIAKENKINLFPWENEMNIENTRIEIIRDFSLNRSEKCICAVSVEYGDNSLVYLSASANESKESRITSLLNQGDYIIFGSYGPKYKKEIKYSLPNMSLCMFLGESRKHANKSFLNHISHTEIEYGGYPARFRLDF